MRKPGLVLLPPLCAASFILVLGFSTWAQLPPAQKLSVEEERGFQKELERLDGLLPTANNRPAIELQIANTYAAGGQYQEAMRRLSKLVGANLGFDPSRDPDFEKLRDTANFKAIMDEVVRQTPPVHTSRLIATVDERDVRPESIAFDVKRNAFVLGNTAKFELLRCSSGGKCFPLVPAKSGEKSYALGLKLDRGADELWATYNAQGTAALRCYELETGKLLRSVSIKGKHVFNDLAISSAGVVYVTDTAEGAVYQLLPGAMAFRKMAPQHPFTAANGIAISDDGHLLYPR